MHNSVSIELTKLKSFARKWTEVTEVELKEMLCVNLLIGLVKSPAMFHCFHKKRLYVVPSITKIIGGRKFKSILQDLHMEGNDQNDQLKKVRPITPVDKI